jgi:hypothetical protein
LNVSAGANAYNAGYERLSEDRGADAHADAEAAAEARARNDE